MKDNILKLRKEGKTYNEIQKLLGCSKGTISYHCGIGQKEKTKNRRRKFINKNPLFKKIEQYKKRLFKMKSRDFQRYRNLTGNFSKGRKYNFTEREVYEKIGKSPKCYLTGRSINLFNTKSYHFDHRFPVSKGGDNSLENLEIACKEANKGKDNLTVEQFIQLCKEVLENNNYIVSKIERSQ